MPTETDTLANSLLCLLKLGKSEPEAVTTALKPLWQYPVNSKAWQVLLDFGLLGDHNFPRYFYDYAPWHADPEDFNLKTPDIESFIQKGHSNDFYDPLIFQERFARAPFKNKEEFVRWQLSRAYAICDFTTQADDPDLEVVISAPGLIRWLTQQGCSISAYKGDWALRHASRDPDGNRPIKKLAQEAPPGVQAIPLVFNSFGLNGKAFWPKELPLPPGCD